MSFEKLNLSRRNALKLIASTAAAVPVMGSTGSTETIKKVASPRPATDPDLQNPAITWDFLLNEAELATLATLCSVIIPADNVSPSASSLGAQHYINEYVSGPYDDNKAALILVRGGVVWLNSESYRRFSKNFSGITDVQRSNICEDIKWEKTASPKHQMGARFFAKVRDLTSTAFYTTEEGMADIGYIGNRPSMTFEGPSPEILKRLGLNT